MPSLWQNSLEKKQLEKDILEGLIPASMPPREAIQKRSEYLRMGKITFGNRLRGLRASLNKERSKGRSDYAAYMHDRSLYPKQEILENGERRWEGSPAEHLLSQDKSNGLIEGRSPKELWLSRPQYQEFSLKVFRRHIYQAEKTEKYLNYLQEKQAKKEEKMGSIYD